MTGTLKVKPYNPVDEMESDEEVIEFLLDCYQEDSEGRTLARAMGFAVDSIGGPRTARLMMRAGIRIGRAAAKKRRMEAAAKPTPAV